MLDDNKHTEAMKVWFTEREFVDLCRLASKDDRKPGEMLRVIVRRAMYGTIGSEPQSINGANRSNEGRSE
jgi:hypothetical protein